MDCVLFDQGGGMMIGGLMMGSSVVVGSVVMSITVGVAVVVMRTAVTNATADTSWIGTMLGSNVAG